MDEAGRFTAEHTVMESGIEIRKLKHLLEVAEDKIKELEKENAELLCVPGRSGEESTFKYSTVFFDRSSTRGCMFSAHR